MAGFIYDLLPRPALPAGAESRGRAARLRCSVHTAIVAVAVAVCMTLTDAVPLPPCPKETPGLKAVAKPGSRNVNVEWESAVPFDVVVYWVNFEGKEVPAMVVAEGMSSTGGTFPGHWFRVRTYAEALLMEYEVPSPSNGEEFVTAVIRPCGSLVEGEDGGPVLYPPGKDDEYQELVHDQYAPCVGPSSNWSCVRTLPYEDYLARDNKLYGFDPDEVEPGRASTLIPEERPHTDASYVRHIAMVPKVSAFGPGYLKMSIPEPLRSKLLKWYADNRGSVSPHEIVPGGYMNENKIHMHRLNLDFYSEMRLAIQQEMQQVMQWWTQMRVRHTSTYGVRIYRRGAMLINHVDRGDTHLASAVIQVAQTVDEDGGWPLEIMLGNKSVGEVYLQPGEMVLYEGAWLRHGRPLRFKGDEFANLFTHYAPYDWNGPGRSEPDLQAPLPFKYHGYSPWRCQTLADVEGSRIGCKTTEAMESRWISELHRRGEFLGPTDEELE